MASSVLPVAIIGLGRVGSTLALALEAAKGIDLVVWDRKPAVRRAAVRHLGRERVATTYRAALEGRRLALLAVPDEAVGLLAPVPGLRTVVAHCSGILDAGALASFQRAGWPVASCHPLRSFARRWEGGRGSLAGTLFALEGSARALPPLRRMASSMGAEPVTLQPGRKALYHAGAALTANHSMFLAHAAARWMKRAGIPERVAWRALALLLASTARHLGTLGPRRGVTGPLARGDVAAVAAHVQALRRDDPQGHLLYQATACIALASGGILSSLPAATRQALVAVLDPESGVTEQPARRRRRPPAGSRSHPAGRDPVD